MKLTAIVFTLLATLSGQVDEDNRPGIDIHEVSYGALEPAAQRLIAARLNHSKEVVLHFDSPGGDLGAMLLFDRLIRHVHLGGTQVICVVDGMAASAALNILEVCDYRVAYEHSTFLAHEAGIEIYGKPVDHERIAKLARALTRIYLAPIAARSIHDIEWWMNKVNDYDYWFDAQEALKLGLVDEIAVYGAYD